MAEHKNHVSSRLTELTDGEGNRYALRHDRGPHRSFGMQFIVTFSEPYARMVTKIKSAPALKLFNLLPRYLSFTEFRRVRQVDIASDLDISQGTVSDALNELAHLGAIERKGAGTSTEWRLSMEWGWRGSAASYHKAKRERAEGATKRPKLKVIRGTQEPPQEAA